VEIVRENWQEKLSLKEEMMRQYNQKIGRQLKKEQAMDLEWKIQEEDIDLVFKIRYDISI